MRPVVLYMHCNTQRIWSVMKRFITQVQPWVTGPQVFPTHLKQLKYPCLSSVLGVVIEQRRLEERALFRFFPVLFHVQPFCCFTVVSVIVKIRHLCYLASSPCQLSSTHQMLTGRGCLWGELTICYLASSPCQLSSTHQMLTGRGCLWGELTIWKQSTKKITSFQGKYQFSHEVIWLAINW